MAPTVIALDRLPEPAPSDGSSAHAPPVGTDASWARVPEADVARFLEKLSTLMRSFLIAHPQKIPIDVLRACSSAPPSEAKTAKAKQSVQVSFHGSPQLTELPSGYQLFMQYRTATGGRPSDKYLFGHPKGVKYRSVNEFLPHAIWLASGRTHECTCAPCGGRSTPASRKRQSSTLDAPPQPAVKTLKLSSPPNDQPVEAVPEAGDPPSGSSNTKESPPRQSKTPSSGRRALPSPQALSNPDAKNSHDSTPATGPIPTAPENSNANTLPASTDGATNPSPLKTPSRPKAQGAALSESKAPTPGAQKPVAATTAADPSREVQGEQANGPGTPSRPPQLAPSLPSGTPVNSDLRQSAKVYSTDPAPIESVKASSPQRPPSQAIASTSVPATLVVAETPSAAEPPSTTSAPQTVPQTDSVQTAAPPPAPPSAVSQPAKVAVLPASPPPAPVSSVPSNSKIHTASHSSVDPSNHKADTQVLAKAPVPPVTKANTSAAQAKPNPPLPPPRYRVGDSVWVETMIVARSSTVASTLPQSMRDDFAVALNSLVLWPATVVGTGTMSDMQFISITPVIVETTPKGGLAVGTSPMLTPQRSGGQCYKIQLYQFNEASSLMLPEIYVQPLSSWLIPKGLYSVNDASYMKIFRDETIDIALKAYLGSMMGLKQQCCAVKPDQRLLDSSKKGFANSAESKNVFVTHPSIRLGGEDIHLGDVVVCLESATSYADGRRHCRRFLLHVEKILVSQSAPSTGVFMGRGWKLWPPVEVPRPLVMGNFAEQFSTVPFQLVLGRYHSSYPSSLGRSFLL